MQISPSAVVSPGSVRTIAYRQRVVTTALRVAALGSTEHVVGSIN